jgi:hypothetical protein
MGTQEIAAEFVAPCRAGKFGEAGERFWSEDIVSIEPMEGEIGAEPGGVHRPGQGPAGRPRLWHRRHRADAGALSRLGPGRRHRRAGRDPSLPEVPSFAEAGSPAATSTKWFGFSAAAGIPAAIAERWRLTITEALAEPRLRERFAGLGVVPGTLGPAEYTAFIAGEPDRWRAVIRAAGVRSD